VPRYELVLEWRVMVEGERIGSVTGSPDGYQAVTVSGEPMYPHLGAEEQAGVTHSTVPEAASELLRWAERHGLVPPIPERVAAAS
jgi:hypothetical protein